MNPRLEALFARRSVRRYTDQPVADAQVRDLLEAAMAAPSACARDPWEFIVLRDGELRAKVAAFLPNGPMLAQAPLGFVVCGDLERAHAGELSYLLQDCSAAIENLLLAAQALGLGAVWLGVHPRQDRIDNLRGLFRLPASILPVACVAVGHPAERPAPRTRYDAARVHPDRW
ncbi:MAG: nitroreductase family protein [Lentisphaeria bacterium]|jgi:nitroreductase|nr:nitroreductase family protein [Lentisphaeria bacterium]